MNAIRYCTCGIAEGAHPTESCPGFEADTPDLHVVPSTPSSLSGATGLRVVPDTESDPTATVPPSSQSGRLPVGDKGAPPALGEILDDVERFVRRYIVLTEEQALAVTLWVAHVYAFAASITTPYLHVSSATMRSGKSRLLEVFDVLLGARSRFTMNISPAALYRVIDANPGTAVLMDESDRTMNGNREKAEELFGLINSGYRRRGGYAIRMVGMGAAMKPQEFATFSPKVIAGIGTLQDTIADRCVPIRMRKRLPTEHVERFHERDAPSADPIRAALETWANPDTIAALADARPNLPTEMDNDRALDAWEPLLAIADMAGEEWSARARSAALSLHGSGASYAEERLELLALGHVREAFEESGEEKLATTSILESLVHRDDGPWAEWWGDAVANGKPLPAARRLGRLLEPFDVKPKTLRIGERTPRGYERADLADAWERHLPVGTATAETTETPLASPVVDVVDVAVPTEPTWPPESKSCPECQAFEHQGGHFSTCSRSALRGPA